MLSTPSKTRMKQKATNNPGDAAHFIGAMLVALQTQYTDQQIIKMLGQKNVRAMLKVLNEGKEEKV